MRAGAPQYVSAAGRVTRRWEKPRVNLYQLMGVTAVESTLSIILVTSDKRAAARCSPSSSPISSYSLHALFSASSCQHAVCLGDYSSEELPCLKKPRSTRRGRKKEHFEKSKLNVTYSNVLIFLQKKKYHYLFLPWFSGSRLDSSK